MNACFLARRCAPGLFAACLLLAVAGCGTTPTPILATDLGQPGDVPAGDLGAGDGLGDALPDLPPTDTLASDVPEIAPDVFAPDEFAPDEIDDVLAPDVGEDAVDVAQCVTASDCAAPAQPCQVAACTQGQCAVANADDATPCDDQDACTENDVCQAGACQAGTQKDCSDGNLCTTDSCLAGTCGHADNALPCSDNDVCTLGDACAAGACLPGAATQCDDGNPCTMDACDAASGCTATALDGAACSDGNACTVGDACQGASCVAQAVAACSDGNPCTDDGCDAASGCVLLPNTATCTDNDACTAGDACAAAACESGAAVDCDDGNPCTIDACDAALGCTHTANADAVCSDANACTVGDACVGGVCVPGAVTPCDDGNACTLNDCAVESGCVNLALPAPCNDGNACTVGDVCKDGACGFTFALACDDGNPCTDDACDPQSGCKFANNTLPCTDYNNCTLGDVCAGGVCKPAAPSSCDDGNPCTTETCDPASGCTKVNNTAPCQDGSVCTVSDGCANGACQPGAALACSDGNPCTVDSCDAEGGCVFANSAAPCSDGSLCTYLDVCSGGVCLPGAQTNCDDGNGCTTDACHPKTGCAHGANALACSDGSLCTVGDACQDGSCVGGAAAVCDDGNLCTTDICVPSVGCKFVNNALPCTDNNLCTEGDLCAAGACVPGAALACDDQNLCTTDSCDAATGCAALANSVACEDGSACTVGDRCKDGGCAGGASAQCDDGNGCTTDSCDAASGCVFTVNTLACSDGNVCTLLDACAGGECAPGAAKVCDDGNPCTTDACDPKLGCVASDNTLPCSDGSVCTQGDACQGGGCHPGADMVCDDGNPCTDDHCDGALGCVHAANTLPCDDQNGCTLGDTCSAGVCVPTTNSTCNDGNPCTTETCNPATGSCTAVNNDAPCNDGDLCTVGDACALGGCKAGVEQVCADGNPCTADSCLPASGCVFLANAATCTDNNLCTEGDGCAAGACVPGAAKACGDGNACTDDSCVPGSGCANTANAAACNDGNACSTGDVCAQGTCAGSGITCDDGNVCTDDSCDAQKGCVFAPNSAPCNDGNGCTGADTCAAGSCAGTKGCDVHALCTPGAQAVSCVCKPYFSGDGFACADIDECLADNGGCGDAAFYTCSNQIGGPQLCADRNECLTDNGGCGDPAIFSCTNNVGAAPTCVSLIGPCEVPADCPGTDTECRWRVCEVGQCNIARAAAGKVLTAQVGGDCQRAQCDGTGQIVSAADAGDVPADDGNACTGEACEGGVPVHPALPASSPCAQDGGTECDGAGKCVACIANNECGVDSVCAQHLCVSGACTTNYAAFGTLVGTQVGGDCQLSVCNGVGDVTATADSGDVPPDDGNQCTGEACAGALAVHPPLDVSATCNQAGGSRCDGNGACVECLAASDCGVDSECQTWSCNFGVCDVANTAEATPVSSQTPGDCRQVQCNGLGAQVAVADAGDVPPDDGIECTGEVCVDGLPDHAPLTAGTQCSQGGGVECNGQGSCVQCLTASECGTDTACLLYTCNAGVCGTSLVADGTPAGTQVPNDCQQVQCNGNGGTKSVADDSDVPVDDGFECTGETCVAGVKAHPAKDAGVACSQGGIKCDGSGACVACLASADCGVDTACQLHSCIEHACVTSNVVSGTVVTAQTAHDCQQIQCDGNGATKSVADSSDAPLDDGNTCTSDVCATGAPVHPAVADGTACSQNGGTVCTSGVCSVSETGLLVLHVGDGSGALANSATQGYIEEYKLSDSSHVGTLTLPTAVSGNHRALTFSGSATSEGDVTRSQDGKYVLVAGYDAPLGTAAVSSSTVTTYQRVVGRIDALGNLDTTTHLPQFSSGVRGVTSTDGSVFWISGNGTSATGGVWYLPFGASATGTQVVSTPSNFRWPVVAGDQLFVSSASANNFGVMQIGSGLPTTLTTATLLNGMPTATGPSSYGLALFDRDGNGSLETLYLADDRTSGVGGVQKWTLSGGTWSLAKLFTPGTGVGCRGLAAWVSGTSVLFAATTTEGSANKLVLFTDDGSASPTLTPTATIATAASNTAFRGVALTPK